MKKKKPEKIPSEHEAKRLIDLLEGLQWMFGVQNYERSITYKESDADNYLATVKQEEDYQRISIEIYPAFWKESREDQRKTILHEFIHTWLHPLHYEACKMLEGKFSNKEMVRFAVERGTSSVENVVDSLLRGKLRYATKAYDKYLKK